MMNDTMHQMEPMSEQIGRQIALLLKVVIALLMLVVVMLFAPELGRELVLLAGVVVGGAALAALSIWAFCAIGTALGAGRSSDHSDQGQLWRPDLD
jgi:hypothetical protein